MRLLGEMLRILSLAQLGVVSEYEKKVNLNSGERLLLYISRLLIFLFWIPLWYGLMLATVGMIIVEGSWIVLIGMSPLMLLGMRVVLGFTKIMYAN